MKKLALAIALGLALATSAIAQQSVLLPNGRQQFFDADGNPLGGGSVGMYVPSTLTPKTTWQDQNNGAANANPVPLDSAGTAVIYGSGDYRQIVQDALGNTIWDEQTHGILPSPAWGGTSTGSANAQIVLAGGFQPIGGRQIAFRAGFANTGSTTLQVGSVGIYTLYKNSPIGVIPLTGGELNVGGLYVAIYDPVSGGLVLTDADAVSFGGALTDIAAAATTNLGTITSHTVNVTGSGYTITSFGSAANTNSPLYFVQFAGAGTITYNSTSMILPGQTSISVTAGDTALALYLGSGNWKIVNWQRASVPTLPVYSNGRFVRTGTTTAALQAYGGNLVSFPSGIVATIPSGGVTTTITSAYLNGTSGSALVASTLYYAYLWNAGTAASPTWVIDWSTTAPTRDTASGIQIKTADATRVLVGMAYPTAGPVLQSTATNQLVASWNNQIPAAGSNAFTTNRSTNQVAYTEINTEIRVNFVSWAGAVPIAYAGSVQNSGSNNSNFTLVSLDGSSAAGMPASIAYSVTATVNYPVGPSGAVPITTGFHYITLLGAVSAGTATWETASSNSRLTVQVNQ